MKRFSFALILSMILALPSVADVEGTRAGAISAVSVARHKHKPITYYTSWAQAEPALSEKSYVYEGIQLSDSAGDFMKNEPIVVILQDSTHKPDGLYVSEEIMYPVWSPTNQAHVLRSYILKRIAPVAPKGTRAAGMYRGIDGNWHRAPSRK